MKKHIRFVAALVLGLVVFGLVQFTTLSTEMRILVAMDVFYVSFLVMVLRLAITSTPETLRHRAETDDEGLPMILTLAVFILVISLIAIVQALNGPTGGGIARRVMALISVPFGWLTIQSLMSFHYAQLYYHPHRKTEEAPLVFPGSDKPDAWDFMYFTFVLAMCAQVSDVLTNSSKMRRVVLAHSVGSFFYNAVILALVVAAITADL
jgi:uncharacterized membrane protein